MKKIIILALVIVGFFWVAKAQQIPVNNFYLNNPYIFNPAATGISGNVTAYMDYTDQWSGIKNAPENANFGVHGLITKVMGVGLQVSSLKQGVFKQNKISLNYSYRLAFAETHTLAFGFSLGMQQNAINFNTVSDALSSDQALYSTNFNEALFEVGLGLHYNFKGLNVHASTPILYGTQEREFFQNAFGMASYDFSISDGIWVVRPAVFYRYTLYQHLVDGVMSASWNNRLMVQAGYRTNNNVIVGAGVNLKGLNISYLYEINRTNLSSASSGGHQIMISYETPFSVNKKAPLYYNSNRQNAWE